MSALSLTADPDAILLPGNEVAVLAPAAPPAPADKQQPHVIRLGTGVFQRDTRFVASKAGKACLDARRSKVWVSSNQRRYEPNVGDAVVAVVTDRHAEEYRVDMAGTDTATLPALAFEGATKRNKPALVVGSSVYCRVTRASKDMECEVSCIEPGSSRSWVGGETLYGELKGGNIIRISLDLAARLQAEDSPILGTLGAAVPFESAVGSNGRLWIKSGTTKSTVLLCLLVAKADELPLESWKKHVARVMSQFKV